MFEFKIGMEFVLYKGKTENLIIREVSQMIVKLNPWYNFNENLLDMYRSGRRYNNLLSDIFSPEKESVSSKYPRISMVENGENITLYSELPGFKKEEIKITVKDDILTLSGKRTLPDTSEKVTWLRHERFHGDFSRSFMLPFELESNGIKAEFKDGILSIELPKREEVKPKEIIVK